MLTEQQILGRIPTDIANDIVVALVQHTVDGHHIPPRITAYILGVFKDQFIDEENQYD